MDAAYHRRCLEALRIALDDPELTLDPPTVGGFLYALGESVYRLQWDSCYPGGGGEEIVRRLGNAYFADGDLDRSGPFDDIDQAIRALTGEPRPICVTNVTLSVACSELSTEELIARMTIFALPERLVINGTAWPAETLEFEYERLTGCPADGT